ncbi:hypothetical protein [Paenibacillus sp. RC67]|uniref:hypothetical protein n=1 Tax=Paenibacillus sp. RC67 TaxID=3039392 RepID=UPI0024AD4D95|nr:hypothetical protein [Paenibacillus sp. RC67]
MIDVERMQQDKEDDICNPPEKNLNIIKEHIAIKHSYKCPINKQKTREIKKEIEEFITKLSE